MTVKTPRGDTKIYQLETTDIDSVSVYTVLYLVGDSFVFLRKEMASGYISWRVTPGHLWYILTARAFLSTSSGM